MINKFLCLTLCLFLARCLYGQRDAQIIHDDIRKFPFRVLTLSDPGEHIRLNNVRSILVVDARPDTLPVGLMQEEHPRAFMGFKKNVRETLNRFLSLYLQPNNLDSLPQVVMVLRKFWISDELSDQVNRLNSIKDDSSRFYRGIV